MMIEVMFCMIDRLLKGGHYEPGRKSYTWQVEDIAVMLNIGRTSAYNLVKEGHFKTVRVGNAIRISKKSFDEWLDAQAF